MTEIRKIVTLREVIFAELGHSAPQPVVRAVGIGVIRNPLPGAGPRICGRCSKRAPHSASG
jgi:hypothetical protein